MAGTASYALDILSCPPSSSIMSIVYTAPTKLSVVEGASTLMSIDLKDFFIPVSNAQQTTFTLAGISGSGIPVPQYSFNFCGLNEDSTAKFAAFFPYFSTKTAPDKQYVEWAFLSEIEDGALATLSPVLIDASGSTTGVTASDTGYLLNRSTSIARVSGEAIGFTATDAYCVGTRGGLKVWSEDDPMVLFNTYNSDISSNNVTSLTVTPSGVIWIGTDSGVSSLRWSSAGGYTWENFDTDNSAIISNTVQDVFYSNGKLAIATDIGISLYDTVNKTWENFSNLTVNEINTYSFNSIFIDGVYVIAGSNDGVYVYDTVNGTWTLYNSAISGWTLSDHVNRVSSYTSEVFAGTTGGVITFSIGGTSCVQLPNMFSSPYESVTGLVYAAGVGASGNDLLFISQGVTAGAISAYDITGNTWSFGVTGAGNLLASGVSQIAVNSDIYFTNYTGFGYLGLTSQTVTSLPLSSQKSDILFSFPENGSFPVALDQKVYIGFSKPVSAASLQNHLTFKNAAGATVAYGLTSTSSNCIYEIVPSSAFDYSTQYTFSIGAGLTSSDGTYFRQTVNSSFYSFDRNPALGWKVLGKQMILSGAEGYSVTPLVFRNPQTFDVKVLALVAI